MGTTTTTTYTTHAVMLSRSFIAARAAPIARRSFMTSSIVRADGEGSTPQSGHTASSGSFKKREKAAEDQYMLERERERYAQSKKKLEEQKKDLDELETKHKK